MDFVYRLRHILHIVSTYSNIVGLFVNTVIFFTFLDCTYMVSQYSNFIHTVSLLSNILHIFSSYNNTPIIVRLCDKILEFVCPYCNNPILLPSMITSFTPYYFITICLSIYLLVQTITLFTLLIYIATLSIQ